MPNSNDPFAEVDWSKTRAYGLGLNGLYVNQRGREREGIVEPGTAADALLNEIRQKLVDIRDPKDNARVITRVDLASEVYQGPYARTGPDALGDTRTVTGSSGRGMLRGTRVVPRRAEELVRLAHLRTTSEIQLA